MNNLEAFPSKEDWEDLLDEMESDAKNPSGIVRPEPNNFGTPIEPDWDALVEG